MLQNGQIYDKTIKKDSYSQCLNRFTYEKRYFSKLKGYQFSK